MSCLSPWDKNNNRLLICSLIRTTYEGTGGHRLLDSSCRDHSVQHQPRDINESATQNKTESVEIFIQRNEEMSPCEEDGCGSSNRLTRVRDSERFQHKTRIRMKERTLGMPFVYAWESGRTCNRTRLMTREDEESKIGRKNNTHPLLLLRVYEKKYYSLHPFLLPLLLLYLFLFSSSPSFFFLPLISLPLSLLKSLAWLLNR